MADLYGNTTDLQSVLTAVNDVKSEVDTQTNLIAQIANALGGKTLPDSGSGGSSGSSGLELILPSNTLTITTSFTDGTIDVYCFDNNGVLQKYTLTDSETTVQALGNIVIVLYSGDIILDINGVGQIPSEAYSFDGGFVIIVNDYGLDIQDNTTAL